jgi:hypothetical protein
MNTSSGEELSREIDLKSDLLPVEEIEAALEAAKSRVEAIEKKILTLEEILVQTKDEQHLLEALIALRRGNQPTERSNSKVLAFVPRAVSYEESNNAVADAAVIVLQDRGRPVHISELMTILEGQNVKLPGQGTQANLISRLRRDERIVRPARGLYALREWGLEDMPVSKQGSRKRQKKTSRAKTGERR